MPYQLYIGLFTEGSTDTRFLTALVHRVATHIAFDCKGQIEIMEIIPIKIAKQGLNMIEQVQQAAQMSSEQYGINLLCIHIDADDKSDENVTRNKIQPIINTLKDLDEKSFCKNITFIIPIQMTEAWLLADKSLLKKQLGTNKPDAELGIDKPPENYANPKEVIKEAIRIALSEKTKRRRYKIDIADIYALMGAEISLEALNNLSSFQKFKNSLKASFKTLNIY